MPETYFEVKNLVNKKTFNVSKLSLIADIVKVNTGIKNFDKIELETGYYSSPDKQSSILGAKAKFFDYFAFAGISGIRKVSDTKDECLQICGEWPDKCCAEVTMNKELRSDDDKIEQMNEINYLCVNQASADGNYGIIVNEF